jgi:hypothetical protein
MKWMISSFVAFVLSLLAAVVLAVWGRKLLGSDRAIFYVIILVPLAAASALVLFKTLRSYATLTGKFANYKLELAGPAVVFMLVIGAGYRFYRNPPFQDFNLVITFEGDGGNLVSGHAIVAYRDRIEDIAVMNGRGSFSTVSPGYEIKIVPSFQGYKRETVRTVLENEREGVHITLSRDTQYLFQVDKLKSEYLSVIDIYLSNAKDLSAGLNRVIDRLLKLDSTALDEAINYSILYAAAYRRLDSVSNGLAYVVKGYSPDLANQLRRLSKEALLFHHEWYIRKYNDDIMALINDYLDKKKIDVSKGIQIKEAVHSFAASTIGRIETMEDEIRDIRTSI